MTTDLCSGVMAFSIGDPTIQSLAIWTDKGGNGYASRDPSKELDLRVKQAKARRRVGKKPHDREIPLRLRGDGCSVEG